MLADLLSLNWQLFEDVNQPAGHQPLLDSLMKIGANDVIFVLPVLLLALWLGLARWSPVGRASGEADAKRTRSLAQRLALLTVGAVALAIALTFALGALIYEPRPFVSHPGIVHLLVAHAADASFPSDHETVASAVAVMLIICAAMALSQARKSGAGSGVARLAAALAVVGVAAAVFIGVARVYVGVHYPGDIAGGALSGAAAAGIATALRKPLEPLLGAIVRVAERLRLA